MKIKILSLLYSLALICLVVPSSFGQTNWKETTTTNQSEDQHSIGRMVSFGNNFAGDFQSRAIQVQTFKLADNAGTISPAFDKGYFSNQTAFYPPGGTASLEIALNIMESADSITSGDGVLAEFNDIYCACVNAEDALKFTNTNETFGLVRNNFMLSIERRPWIGKNDTLFLRLTRYAQKNYQFVFKPTNLLRPNLFAFLVDKYTGISTPLDISDTTTVEFSINSDAASINQDRFTVVFNDATVLPVVFTGIKAKLKGKNIAVEWQVSSQVNVHHYEVEKSADGIKFSKVNSQAVATTATYSWLDAQVFTGDNFYRVGGISDNGKTVYSKIVNVNTGKVPGGIRLLQNPIAGGAIDIYFSDLAAGKYQVRLLNMLGQPLFTKELRHFNGSVMEKIILPSNFAKGVYNLEITGAGKKAATLRLIND